MHNFFLHKNILIFRRFFNSANRYLKIIKKPRNYILKDKEIIKLIRAYKRLKLSYCRIDYGKIIRVICNGIDYIRINKNYNDKVYLFDEHKHEYKYIGNDWYVKNYNVTI